MVRVAVLIILLLRIIHCNSFITALRRGGLISSVRHAILGDSTENLKAELLTLARKVNKGLTESSSDKQEVLRLFEELERRNIYNNTLSSPDLSAVWSLEYTTSDSLIQRGSSVTTSGPILQTIDTRDIKDLLAENTEVRVYPVGPLKIKVPFKVKGELTPVSPSKVSHIYQYFESSFDSVQSHNTCKLLYLMFQVNVKFKYFTVGPVSFPAPQGDAFTSWLDITYLDRDIRLSRGAKGNIFVLSRFRELE